MTVDGVLPSSILLRALRFYPDPLVLNVAPALRHVLNHPEARQVSPAISPWGQLPGGSKERYARVYCVAAGLVRLEMK